MSLHEYEASKRIALKDYPFYGIIMAAMRQADTDNLAALQRAFPEVWTELQRRYNAPMGMLPGESVPATLTYTGRSKPIPVDDEE